MRAEREGRGERFIFRAECDSTKFAQLYFHHQQVNITHEYAKETLRNQMLNIENKLFSAQRSCFLSSFAINYSASHHQQRSKTEKTFEDPHS